MKIKGYDTVLILTIMVIFGFGSLMVLSATCFMSNIEYDTNPFAYIQLRNAIIGLTVFISAAAIPYTWYENRKFIYSVSFLLFSVLLGMLVVSGFANEAKGASRWVFGLQPSEFAKIILILLFSFLLKKNQDKLNDYKVSIIFNYGILFIFLILIVLQPSYTITALTFLIITTMIYISGTKFKHLFYTALLIAPILLGVLLSEEYRRDRVFSYFTPDAEKSLQQNDFQLNQSKIAIGNGGVFGIGLGESLAKERYLPEAHNDFIFAIICDEVGFLGASIFILVYLSLIYQIYKVASNTMDRFGFLIVVGIGTKIVIFALANMLIAVGAIPTTGVTLPLISYGGSNLMVTMLSLGIVVNISRTSYLERKNGPKRA